MWSKKSRPQITTHKYHYEAIIIVNAHSSVLLSPGFFSFRRKFRLVFTHGNDCGPQLRDIGDLFQQKSRNSENDELRRERSQRADAERFLEERIERLDEGNALDDLFRYRYETRYRVQLFILSHEQAQIQNLRGHATHSHEYSIGVIQAQQSKATLSHVFVSSLPDGQLRVHL